MLKVETFSIFVSVIEKENDSTSLLLRYFFPIATFHLFSIVQPSSHNSGGIVEDLGT